VTDCVVYILECADGTLYTGWTINLDHRLAAHNAGQGARYTRSRRPVRLVYCETVAGQSEALRREAALRRAGRAAKLQLIAAYRSSNTSNQGASNTLDLFLSRADAGADVVLR
jgi:putative endonuclease